MFASSTFSPASSTGAHTSLRYASPPFLVMYAVRSVTVHVLGSSVRRTKNCLNSGFVVSERKANAVCIVVVPWLRTNRPSVTSTVRPSVLRASTTSEILQSGWSRTDASENARRSAESICADAPKVALIWPSDLRERFAALRSACTSCGVNQPGIAARQVDERELFRFSHCAGAQLLTIGERSKAPISVGHGSLGRCRGVVLGWLGSTA